MCDTINLVQRCNGRWSFDQNLGRYIIGKSRSFCYVVPYSVSLVGYRGVLLWIPGEEEAFEIMIECEV